MSFVSTLWPESANIESVANDRVTDVNDDDDDDNDNDDDVHDDANGNNANDDNSNADDHDCYGATRW